MVKLRERRRDLSKSLSGVKVPSRVHKPTKAHKRQPKVVVKPTIERLCKGSSRSAGLATKFDSPIERLRASNHLIQDQYEILQVYADQSRLAEKSPMRDSCDFTIRGNGGGEPSPAIISARLATHEMEAKAGALVSILQAIVRDERSISDYCIERYGGRERYDHKGRFVAIVPRREKVVIADARRELRAVANRLLD